MASCLRPDSRNRIIVCVPGLRGLSNGVGLRPDFYTIGSSYVF